MNIANRSAPWKIASGTENFVLQSLQFQLLGFCLNFTGGTDISYCRLNEDFVEGQFSVSA
jgi:hypothetical protein